MKTSSIRNQIGVFCQCVLLYTKPPGKTSAPSLDVRLYAGEVHDIVKSVCKISRKNLASGQGAGLDSIIYLLMGDVFRPQRRLTKQSHFLQLLRS